jgi:hypothetical protein
MKPRYPAGFKWTAKVRAACLIFQGFLKKFYIEPLQLVDCQ